MKHYIICYDVSNNSRRAKVAQIAYSYAFGGQKSAIESYLTKNEMQEILKKLKSQINHKQDRINIIEVEQKTILLGVAKQLSFDKGVIVL